MRGYILIILIVILWKGWCKKYQNNHQSIHYTRELHSKTNGLSNQTQLLTRFFKQEQGIFNITSSKVVLDQYLDLSIKNGRQLTYTKHLNLYIDFKQNLSNKQGRVMKHTANNASMNIRLQYINDNQTYMQQQSIKSSLMYQLDYISGRQLLIKSDQIQLHLTIKEEVTVQDFFAQFINFQTKIIFAVLVVLAEVVYFGVITMNNKREEYMFADVWIFFMPYASLRLQKMGFQLNTGADIGGSFLLVITALLATSLATLIWLVMLPSQLHFTIKFIYSILGLILCSSLDLLPIFFFTVIHLVSAFFRFKGKTTLNFSEKVHHTVIAIMLMLLIHSESIINEINPGTYPFAFEDLTISTQIIKLSWLLLIDANCIMWILQIWVPYSKISKFLKGISPKLVEEIKGGSDDHI